MLRECDPDNLHALANLVPYYVTTGDLTRANQCADRLATLPLPEDPTEVAKQIERLSILDRDAEIGRLAAEAHKRFRDLPPVVYVHWGIALANSGRRREALKHLRRVQESGDKSSLLETTLEAIERGQPGPGIADRFPQTHFSDLMGRESLDEITKLIERGEKAGQPDKRAWADLLKRNPQLPLVARRMLYEAPDSAPAMPIFSPAYPHPPRSRRYANLRPARRERRTTVCRRCRLSSNRERCRFERGEVERANTYLDRALEIDPLYVFSRGSRALQALQRDDIEKAKEWIEPLHTVRKWHPVGFAYYQKVMARIAIAEGEYESARRHLELASQFSEAPEINKLLKSVNMLAELGGFGDWWREMADRYRSRRQKASLPPDPTLADCFGLLTKGDMTGIR